MLGHQLDDKMLKDIIDEVDADGSGELEFEEFVSLAARFLVEEDAEAMQQELKEAFRLYDKGNGFTIISFIMIKTLKKKLKNSFYKEGNGYITTAVLKEILRELDDSLTNDDLDSMIEGQYYMQKWYFLCTLRDIFLIYVLEIDSDGSGTVDFDGI